MGGEWARTSCGLPTAAWKGPVAILRHTETHPCDPERICCAVSGSENTGRGTFARSQTVHLKQCGAGEALLPPRNIVTAWSYNPPIEPFPHSALSWSQQLRTAGAITSLESDSHGFEGQNDNAKCLFISEPLPSC